MVEKISQPDNEFSIVIEGIKNSMNLFAERVSIVKESLQGNMHAQEEVFNAKENEVVCSCTSITTTLTSSQSC